jgi:hypothetical protein
MPRPAHAQGGLRDRKGKVSQEVLGHDGADCTAGGKAAQLRAEQGMVTKGPASRAAAHFRGPSSRPGLWRRRQGCPEPRRRPQTPACARQHQGVQQRPSCQRTSSVVSSFTSANCSVSCIAAASADTSACSTSSFLVFLPSRATQGFASEAHAAGARATARTCRCPRRLEPRAPAGAQAPRSGRLSWRSPVQKAGSGGACQIERGLLPRGSPAGVHAMCSALGQQAQRRGAARRGNAAAEARRVELRAHAPQRAVRRRR